MFNLNAIKGNFGFIRNSGIKNFNFTGNLIYGFISIHFLQFNYFFIITIIIKIKLKLWQKEKCEPTM